MSLCVDSRALKSRHVTITFSELVAFPPAVHAKPKAKNNKYMMRHFYAIDQHNGRKNIKKNILSLCGTVAIFILASDMENVHPARTCKTCPREFMRISGLLAWHIKLKEIL